MELHGAAVSGLFLWMGSGFWGFRVYRDSGLRGLGVKGLEV